MRNNLWKFVLALASMVVMASFSTAQANARSESKTYDGSIVADCGRTLVEDPRGNRTEICFDIQTGDQTLDLIVTDDTGLSVAGLVYFQDDDDNFIDSRGYAEHVLCNRGDWGGYSQGPLLDPENPRTPLVGYEPLFEVPTGATKVLIFLGDSGGPPNGADAYPVQACLIAGRPSHWGSTGTINAIFDGE